MTELKQALLREQAPVNAAIERTVADLPPGSQPVARHVFSAGGKRLRPFLTVTIGKALGCHDEALYTLGAAVEMLHAASLIHDDILDNADTRRGQPAAHTVFGPAAAVLAGDAMLAMSMLTVSRLGTLPLVNCISEAVMRTAAGQIKEFSHIRDADITQADYLEIITGKTAWMLRASCELGALHAGAEAQLLHAATTFGLEMGIAFQMVDDALDFAEGTGKPTGGDVREGKVTPPLLSYIASLPEEEARSFKQRFAAGPLPDDEADAICRAVQNGGHAAAARNAAAKHLAAAGKELDVFSPSRERTILREMLEYILARAV